jgi:4-hydroxy-4-methyl-2-oxoglutarate aldolase
MFTIHQLPPQIDPDLLTLLEQAEPATIGHFLDFGFVDPAVRAMFDVPRVAGTAVTVRFAGADCTILHYALGQVRPGDVLVVDRAGDNRHGAVGGGVAFAAKEAGVHGIVMDGMATDIAELRQHRLPVWARGLSTVTGKRLFQQGEFCVPINCGGVPVAPGDAVLADENGVLILKPDQIRAAATRAMQMQRDEHERMPEIAAGRRLPELNGTNERLAQIMAAQQSRQA